MTYANHRQAPPADWRKLDFTLWRLTREYAGRHQQEVNRILSERPRARGQDPH